MKPVKGRNKIAVLQPEVPHYREEFFRLLSEQCETMDVFVYNSFEQTRKHGFNINLNDNIKYIANRNIHEVLIYNPFPLLNKRYDTLVLMLHFGHITTWLLLLTKWPGWGYNFNVKSLARFSLS